MKKIIVSFFQIGSRRVDINRYKIQFVIFSTLFDVSVTFNSL